jgi:PiT family inorganic phosphate transporter
MTVLLLAGVLFLAFSNGANDNFKGVSTLYGSRTASYRVALGWATLTTLAGSLCALALASGLVKTFSARGLVPAEVATNPAFLASVALGAAATVLLATRLGMPISTTHALTGALVGAGLAAAASAVQLAVLGRSFLLPLLTSPLLAAALTATLYLGVRGVARVLARGQGPALVPAYAGGGRPPAPGVIVGGAAALPDARRAVDVLHFLAAGALSFSRGLNDTPKIFALLATGALLGAQPGLLAVGAAMAVGGLLGARRVAETVSRGITPFDAPQGLVAIGTSAALVIGASWAGMPVSTTHISSGSLFGIGLLRGEAKWGTIRLILLAWVTTLPLGAALGGAAYLALG